MIYNTSFWSRHLVLFMLRVIVQRATIEIYNEKIQYRGKWAATAAWTCISSGLIGLGQSCHMFTMRHSFHRSTRFSLPKVTTRNHIRLSWVFMFPRVNERAHTEESMQKCIRPVTSVAEYCALGHSCESSGSRNGEYWKTLAKFPHDIAKSSHNFLRAQILNRIPSNFVREIRLYNLYCLTTPRFYEKTSPFNCRAHARVCVIWI